MPRTLILFYAYIGNYIIFDACEVERDHGKASRWRRTPGVLSSAGL